jgi:alpha-beta hydrolase superfamily lysophospholipase
MTHVLTSTARAEMAVEAGGLNIFVRSWRPLGVAPAVIAICHGFNAHSDRP